MVGSDKSLAMNDLRVLDAFVVKVELERAKIFEQHITILLQDRPRWLPHFLWKKIINRLIAVQEYNK
jgi:hypothetical protein